MITFTLDPNFYLQNDRNPIDMPLSKYITLKSAGRREIAKKKLERRILPLVMTEEFNYESKRDKL